MSRLTACLLAGATLGVAQTTPPPQVFRSTADTVPVFVTVTDKSRRLVTDLTRDDFQVFDNGKLQPITLFDNTPQPIRIIVLLDVSGSMTGNLPLLRRAAGQLIAHLGLDDLARVGIFGSEITISPTFTRNASELVAALPQTVPPGPTPLWYAVDQAIGEFASASKGRRVVLVMSDSKDKGPPRFGKVYLTQIEISNRAQREDVMVYGIGVRSMLDPGAVGGGASGVMGALASTFPDPGLGTVADETGGGYFELRGRDDLASAFGRVVDELHQQYLLGFTPPKKDGKTHKIEVKVAREGAKPRARKTYQASK